MATITSAFTIASADLLSNNVSFSATANLTTAGTSTGLSKTSGLARTTIVNDPIQSRVVYRSDDATSGGANKVYLKNMSATASEYFTVFIDEEEMGRLYAGDWAFFPWSATAGTKETFIVTIANTWAAGDTWDFDGITTIAANSTAANIATQIDNQHYPNWTTTVSSAAVTFTARTSAAQGVVTSSTAITGDTVTTAGDGTAAITSGAVGTQTESDIIIVPSVVTTMTMEHMLFHE